MQQQTVIKISGSDYTSDKNKTWDLCFSSSAQFTWMCTGQNVLFKKNQRNANSELFPKKPNAKSEKSADSTEVSIVMHLSKSR